MNGNRGKQNTPRKRRKNQQGFTLIEVIVALTITGFLLGGLFSLVGGSKLLARRRRASARDTAACRVEFRPAR